MSIAELEKLSRADLDRMERLLLIRDTRLRFALDCHVNTRGDRMDFDLCPHIRALYNSLSPVVVIMGSVQSYKTEWAVIDHFAAAFIGLSVFYVVPKFEARTTYVQNRVNRCVEHVEEYKRIIGEGFFDSVALKSFGKGVIKYVGSNVLADFKEFPADMVVVDEVDECDADNVQYARDRLRASPYQFRRYLGNPKLKGYGIHAFFAQSDQREWFVPCKSCGEMSMLDWFAVVVEPVTDKAGQVVSYRLRDQDWVVGCRRDIKCVCPNCGGDLERSSIDGKWVAQNPESVIEGYHISMLCSPLNSVAEMWTEFQVASNDPLRMQQFYNSCLGLPYAAMGNKVTTELLDSCALEGYEFDIEPDCAHVPGDGHVGPCSMGVDVGGNFDIRISCMEGGVRKMVYIGKLRLSLEELCDLIDRYNVEKCVIDSQPEITLVQDFQEMAHCDVWACRYQREGKDGRRNYDVKDRVINADRTECLDRGFAQLRKKRVLLPVNYSSILSGQFAAEMCAPVREVMTDDRGNARYEWSKCKDHQRHADAYDLLASNLMTEATIDEVIVG